jgi:hypothetical protein
MSFFGFDTTNPAKPEITSKQKRNKSGKKKETAVESSALVFDGDALDEMLEKKYAQEQGIIEEFEDEENLETFKVNKQEIGFL